MGGGKERGWLLSPGVSLTVVVGAAGEGMAGVIHLAHLDLICSS
jgi:hypothetical protein